MGGDCSRYALARYLSGKVEKLLALVSSAPCIDEDRAGPVSDDKAVCRDDHVSFNLKRKACDPDIGCERLDPERPTHTPHVRYRKPENVGSPIRSGPCWCRAESSDCCKQASSTERQAKVSGRAVVHTSCS